MVLRVCVSLCARLRRNDINNTPLLGVAQLVTFIPCDVMSHSPYRVSIILHTVYYFISALLFPIHQHICFYVKPRIVLALTLS